MKRNFLIPNTDNIVTGIDFGQGDDVGVKVVYERLTNGSLSFLSQEVIGKATDFDTEEKINQYIEKL